jgi:hypothetical protein
VAAVHESVELAAAPADADDDLGLERCEELSERTQRHRVEPAALETRDDIVAEARSIRDIDLPEPKPMAKGSGDAADAKVVHHAILDRDAYLRIAGG